MVAVRRAAIVAALVGLVAACNSERGPENSVEPIVETVGSDIK